MSRRLTDLLDLELAWRRVKFDEASRVFVREPHFIRLVELDSEKWLQQIQDGLESDRYSPRPAAICDVPKGNGEVRPGAILSLEDRVVYAALVGACMQGVKDTVGGPPVVDFSYVFPDDVQHAEWFTNRFTGWDKFREASLEKIDEGASYVVISDISAFYDNIDISILLSDLRQVGVADEVVGLLSKCLNRWAQVPGRGIPQGHSPSDVLGKLYLNAIDVSLRMVGFEHFRYVDDIRIFCPDRAQAKSGILALARLLRPRGLNIQSAKLDVWRSDIARRRIEGVAPIIKSMSKRFVKGAIALIGLESSSYMSLWRAEELMKLAPSDMPMEIIYEAFKTYFVDAQNDRFNPVLFRFLLNRMRRQHDGYASGYCLKAIEMRPEVTEPILEYWKGTDTVDDIEYGIVEYLKSDECVYGYQIYQILEWRASIDGPPGSEMCDVARSLAFSGIQPRYVRSAARFLLAKFGSAADLERLLVLYPDSSPLEQSEILCCLKRMEPSRRNSFLARATGDGDWQKRAGDWVKSQP